MRIDAWQLVWLCTAISSLMEHFMPIRLPLWHFSPTVTLARFWHLIGWSAMKQPIRIQDYKSGPRVMRGDAGQLWSWRAQRKCRCDSGNICHTASSSGQRATNLLSRFICVVNFEKTIMVSMLSRSWSDLHQSSPLSGARIEDSVSRSSVDREMRMRDMREVLAFVISGYLGSATLPCPGSVFMLRWFTRCHVSHVTLVTCNAEVSQQIFVLV